MSSLLGHRLLPHDCWIVGRSIKCKNRVFYVFNLDLTELMHPLLPLQNITRVANNFLVKSRDAKDHGYIVAANEASNNSKNIIRRESYSRYF